MESRKVEMRKISNFSVEKIIYIAFLTVIALFFAGIIWINFNAARWCDYDIYTDALVAKYMWEERTFFPEGWTFGNQLYIVATPAVAALIYGLTSDSVLSLGIASCVMMLLIVCTFIWCVYPFVQKKNLIVGILCLIGGTLFSESASSDQKGMQIFFTMASYYACYLIGALFTMGIWLRLRSELKVNLLLYILCFLLNCALSMQSLREMLVLNLPLCALALFLRFAQRKTQKAQIQLLSRSNIFAVVMLAAGILGLVLIGILKKQIPINQIDILSNVNSDILANMYESAIAFVQYAGLYLPGKSLFSVFRFTSAIVILAVVVYSLLCIVRKDRVSPISCMIQFCVVSLGAVFCAGVFIISVRAIYYFVWHLLVALAFMYTVEELRMFHRLKICLLTGLLLIGSMSLFFQFNSDIHDFSAKQKFYKEISDTLINDGITHVYYDVWGMFHASRVAAFADDKITYCAYSLWENEADSETDNILTCVKYLCHSDWFDQDNKSQAYLMLAGETLAGETLTFNCDALLSHLTLVHHFAYQDEEHYFYKFDDVVFQDMISD